MKRLVLTIGILLVTSTATSMAEDSAVPRASETMRGCRHAPELVAAKRALAEGDREGALQHLQRARELAAACERDAVDRAPEPEGRTPASALARAPAGADDHLYYWARSNDTWPRI
jgi:hypothetical protein